LGVSVERSSRLIQNDPADLFVSPVIKDRKRPLTAVFHATYSFSYVTELDKRMLENEWRNTRKAHFLQRLRKNVARIEEGVAVVSKHVSLDDDGVQFMSGYYHWVEGLIAAGRKVLHNNRPGAIG
jgi:HEXXH motif-containing protein